jgi:hypothetical protein
MTELNMDYNSERPDLVIPEYGRNIQRMVEYAVSIKSKELRNQVAVAIINVMGQLFPHLRDEENYKHKLWDHIFIMSGFELDVDSPYPKPSPQQFQDKPATIEYPSNDIKFGHYGKILEQTLKTLVNFPDGEDKDRLIVDLANMMKRMYITGAESTISDEAIIRQIKEFSGGKIEWKEEWTLSTTNELVPQQNVQNRKRKKNPKKKARRKY